MGFLKKSRLNIQGQSSLELLIVLPLLGLLGALSVQLIWVLLAQHLVHTATSYVALYAATAPADTVGQQLIFQQRMQPLRQTPQVLARISLLTPSADLTRQGADYDATTNFYEVDPAFASLHLKARLSEQEAAALAWLQLNVVQVEVFWCFRLQVPGVAILFQYAATWQEGNRSAQCAVYAGATGAAYYPLRALVQTPLHRKRQWRLEKEVG